MEHLVERFNRLSPRQHRLLCERLSRRLPKAARYTAPASANQKYLWSLDVRSKGNPAWNVFTGSRLSGPLNVEALRRSLQEIVARHDALRAALVATPGGLQQTIGSDVEVELPVLDLSSLGPDDRREELKHRVTGCMAQPFDVTQQPLFRCNLFRLTADEHSLLIVMHHVITDWVSFAILNSELGALYEAFSAGEPSPLAPMPAQYSDYCTEEQQWLGGAGGVKQLSYWRSKLQRAPTLELPLDYSRPQKQTPSGSRWYFTIPPAIAEALKSLSRCCQASLFMTLLAAFALVLHSESEQEEVVIGTPVAGREHKQTENLIGLLLNHVALRLDLSERPRFVDLITRVRTVVLEAYANQRFPFGRLVDELATEADDSRMPLFQVMFFFLSGSSPTTLGRLRLQHFEAYAQTSRYDLLLAIWDGDGRVRGFFEYNTDLFAPHSIERLHSRFQGILARAASDPNFRMNDVAVWRSVRAKDSSSNS